MARKHIKVHFVTGVLSTPNTINSDRLTPEECLDLAQRAEALNHQEWAQYWLDQSLLEERHLQYQLEIGL